MKKFYSFLLAIVMACGLFGAKASSATPTFLDGDPIYNPIGTEYTYVLNYREVGTYGDYSFKGLKFAMRVASDGKTIYMNTLTPEYNFLGKAGDNMSWVKGTMSYNNDITIPGGQKLCVDPSTGEAFYMLFGSLDADNNMLYESEMIFNINADGSISVAEQCKDWRIVVYQTASEGAGIWAILYDYEITSFSPGAAVEPSATTATYIQTSTSSKRIVDVAFDGDKCYIKGVFADYSDDWVVGTVAGNTLTIDANQLFTHDPIYYARLGFGVENGYDDNWNVAYDRKESATFTISDDRTTITPTNSEIQFLETDFAGTHVYSGLTVTSYTKFDVAPAVPATPNILGWDDDPGYETLIVSIPDESVDGGFVNTEWLTYSVTLDGKLYTFTKDKYQGISANMDAIPYAYTDDYWDIVSSGNMKRVAMKDLDWSVAGVYSTYTVNGEAKNSETAYYTREAGVDAITAVGTAVAKYYNLQGIELNANNLPKGLVIKKQGDKAVKIVIK